MIRYYRSPLLRAIVFWHLAWGGTALLTRASSLIQVLNGLMFAVACGVIVAYMPIVIRALAQEKPSQGDILSVGIWLAWVSLIEGRIWSITWRYLGTPDWLVNTDITTHIISLALLAGLMHLAGPEAIEGRVPTKQWLRIGAIVAVGVLFAIALVLLFGDSGALIRPRSA